MSIYDVNLQLYYYIHGNQGVELSIALRSGMLIDEVASLPTYRLKTGDPEFKNNPSRFNLSNSYEQHTTYST